MQKTVTVYYSQNTESQDHIFIEGDRVAEFLAIPNLRFHWVFPGDGEWSAGECDLIPADIRLNTSDGTCTEFICWRESDTTSGADHNFPQSGDTLTYDDGVTEPEASPPVTTLTGVQQRVRDLLLAHPWFGAPVQVFIEDKAGLQFMLDKALAPMPAPAVIVMSASGEESTRVFGCLNLVERINVYFLQTPLTDASDRMLVEGVQAAMSVLHGAVIPGLGPRITVAGHGAIEGAFEAQLAHEVRLEIPLQIAVQ